MDALSLYAIKRVQPAQGSAYWRVDFTRCRQRFVHCFHDAVYSGSQPALRAAVAWRDGLLAHAEARYLMERRQAKLRSGTQRVEGVHFLTPKHQPAGVWRARLELPDGSVRHKHFSVGKYGSDQAFKLAVATRKEMLLQSELKRRLDELLAKDPADSAKARSGSAPGSA